MSQKVKITFKKLLEFNNSLGIIDTNKKDRLSLSTVDFIRNMKYPFEQYNKKNNKIEQELCSVDADGNFFLDEKKNPIYSKFNKENEKKRGERLEALLNEEVEIEPALCLDLTRVKTLHCSVIKLFNGFLFNVSDQTMQEWFLGEVEDEKNDNESVSISN